ncbi:MAG: iron-containing alcohol dehydrogenase, partial [Chloroflexi bacterium]|nr:iron-containing alcohol dehydrogenase [Chloroflexota bacterium]
MPARAEVPHGDSTPMSDQLLVPGAFPPLPAFGVARVPRIVFGPGRISELAEIVAGLGTRALLVTGARSFRASPAWAAVTSGLDGAGIAWEAIAVDGEPSPGLVDAAVAERRADPPDVVVGIGGGSALDAAKAIAGLLRSGTTTMDHLEGVGRGIPYPGPATPFVAVPTTAGTGSEATKNAVLAERGPAGFKRSFRDERLVPTVALLDPDLLAGCPPALVAGDGMDALTQLIEPFTSTGASPFSDAIAMAGMEAARDGLMAWHAAALAGAPDAVTLPARTRMSWAALCSGISLANAGLGAVHGLVAPLGAVTGVGHGTGCGILLAATTRANVAALAARGDPDSPALWRYAAVGRLLTGDASLPDADAREALVDILAAWTVA